MYVLSGEKNWFYGEICVPTKCMTPNKETFCSTQGNHLPVRAST